ncbi:DapH/DapD/GlmU-related protein [Streptococcus sp. A34]|uniref:DapH/DapD/GlmU-related protein n=1 Tax=Streptococcus sp. A34 TaxID=3373130 RepID=UPI00374C9267
MSRSSNYSILEKIENVLFLIITKLSINKARLIRFPFVVRGKKYINFGNNLTVGRYCRFDVLGVHSTKILKFGNNINIGDAVRISCIEGIKIGNNALIGSRVLIIDNSHGSYTGAEQDSPLIKPNERKLTSSPIVIKDNVWIGDGVVVQKGVTIGEGSIIGANSVVTKSIPPHSIAAGVPANIIKIYSDKNQEWEKFNNL